MDSLLKLREEAGYGSATTPPIATPTTSKKNNSGTTSILRVRSGDAPAAPFPPSSISSTKLYKYFTITLEIRNLLRVIVARLPTSSLGLIPLDNLDIYAYTAEGFIYKYKLIGRKS